MNQIFAYREFLGLICLVNCLVRCISPFEVRYYNTATVPGCASVVSIHVRLQNANTEVGRSLWTVGLALEALWRK